MPFRADRQWISAQGSLLAWASWYLGPSREHAIISLRPRMKCGATESLRGRKAYQDLCVLTFVDLSMTLTVAMTTQGMILGPF